MKRTFALLFSALIAIHALAQTPIQLDTSFCISQPLRLQSLNIYDGIQWSATDQDVSLETPNQNITHVIFDQPGTYQVIASGVGFNGNVVRDGGFHLFDVSQNFEVDPDLNFQTTYSRANGNHGAFITNVGQFRVDDEIIAWSSNGNNICNELESRFDTVLNEQLPTGNFLYFDSYSASDLSPTASLVDKIEAYYVWRQSDLLVSPNTTYMFHMRVANWGGEGDFATEFAVSINDELLMLSSDNEAADSIYKVPTNCRWETVTGTWFSGSNTGATVSIGAIGFKDVGHDGALTDIALYESYEVIADTFNVTVLDCSSTSVTSDFSICEGDEAIVEFQVEDGYFSGWYNESNVLISTQDIYSFFPVDTTVLIAQSNNLSHYYLSDGAFEQSQQVEVTTGYRLAEYWDGSKGSYMIYRGASGTRIQGGVADHTNDSIGGGIWALSLENNLPIFLHETNLGTGDMVRVSFSVRDLSVSYSSSPEPSVLVMSVNDSVFWSTAINQSTEDWEDVSVVIRAWEENDYAVRLFSSSSAWNGVVGIDDLQIENFNYLKSDSVIVSPYDCTVLSSSTEYVESDYIAVWPNPTSEFAIIQSENAIELVEVFNQFGQLVLSSKKWVLDLSTIGKGAFIVRVYTDQAVCFERLIIE